MATLDIPNRYLALSPVMVTSPTTRCGTTLVQRLLTASDNGFVYGEEIGHQLRGLTVQFVNQIGYFENHAADTDEAFQRALEGRLDDWRPGLSAPSDVMLKAWTDIYYRLPMGLAEFGRSIGRPLWGFKWPACPPDIARVMLNLMPQAKVIYVYRNLPDALASAKARRFVKTEAEADAFCAEWAASMTAFEALRPTGRVLYLRYESLVDDPHGAIRTLEAFSRMRNIRASVLAAKVNTFIGERQSGHSPSQYIEPEPLTAADLASIHARAADLMAEHYPPAQTAARAATP
jgi:hypothetical protein